MNHYILRTVKELSTNMIGFVVDVTEDSLPKLLKDVLDDSKDYVYINNIIRIRE